MMKITESKYQFLDKNALPGIWRLITGLTLGLSLSLLVGGKAEAVTLTFTKIADTNTPIPGGTGNFGFYPYDNGPSIPSINNGNVAFNNSSLDENYYRQNGIYTSIGGSLQLVADLNTAIPGDTNNFYSFDPPLIDSQGSVAFWGGDTPYCNYPRECNYPGGIYTNVGGSLNVVSAEPTNPSGPGDVGNFIGLGREFSIDNGNIAFVGITSFAGSGGAGIYIDTNAGDALKVVADGNTPIPGGIGSFNYFRGPSLANGNVAFFGSASTSIGTNYLDQQGIYTNIGGSLQVVADFNTGVPSGTGNFVGFDNPLLDQDGNVAFKGYESFFSQQGIYTNIGGSLAVVADTNTAIPDGTGSFGSFGNFSFDNGNAVFLGSSVDLAPESQPGIYTNIGGSLTKVLAYDDSLDGKTIRGLNLGSQALSGNQIAFLANFTDGSSGIYVATTTSTAAVPEPSCVVGVLTFGALGAGSRLRRKQQQKVTRT